MRPLARGDLSVTAELLSADGKALLSLPNLEIKDGKTRFEIPVRGLGKGTYLFRARAKVGDAAGRARRRVQSDSVERVRGRGQGLAQDYAVACFVSVRRSIACLAR